MNEPSGPDAPWLIRRIQLGSFLGARSLDISVNTPFLVLLGPNGSGKTTVLSAVEWALFGELSLGSDYFITAMRGNRLDRHQVYIHDDSAEASVTVEFSKEDSRLVWSRKRSRSRPQPEQDLVECTLDGVPLEPEPELLFRVDHAAYVRTIAPRQSALRALVRSEQQDRDQALDDLFGLGPLNTLTTGLRQSQRDANRYVADLRTRLSEMAAGIEREIEARMTRRSRARVECIENGTPSDNLSLVSLTERIAASAMSLNHDVPLISSVKDAGNAVDELQKSAENQWSSPGPQQQLQRLNSAAAITKEARDAWQQALQAANVGRDSLSSHRADRGEDDSLQEQLESADIKVTQLNQKLSAANEQAQILDAAREWLQPHEQAEHPIGCPVCARKIDAKKLRETVDSLLEGLSGADGAVAQIEAELKAAREAARILRTAANERNSLIQAFERASGGAMKLQQELASALNQIAAAQSGETDLSPAETEVLSEVSRIASMQGNMDAESLDRELRTLLDRWQPMAQKARDEIASAGRRLADVRRELVAHERVIEFLQADEELGELDLILQSPSIQDASDKLSGASVAATALTSVMNRAAEFALQQATKVAEGVSLAIADWYGRISRHSKYDTAEISAQTERPGGAVRNSYRIRVVDSDTDASAQPGPKLSGGYEMLLAVSALCAVSEGTRAGHRFGALMLDEPTESLDAQASEKMARALGLNSSALLTVVTTTDERFAKHLVDGAGSGRATVYQFEEWPGQSVATVVTL